MKFELRPLFRERGTGEGEFWGEEHHLTAHTSHNKQDLLSGLRGRGQREAGSGAQETEPFSLCVYDACRPKKPRQPKTFVFSVVTMIWGVFQNISLYYKPTAGGCWGEGGVVCKLCVFFSVVFFYFLQYLFIFRRFVSDQRLCVSRFFSSLASFRLVLENVNMTKQEKKQQKMIKSFIPIR